MPVRYNMIIERYKNGNIKLADGSIVGPPPKNFITPPPPSKNDFKKYDDYKKACDDYAKRWCKNG